MKHDLNKSNLLAGTGSCNSKNACKFEFKIDITDDQIFVNYNWISNTQHHKPFPFDLVQSIKDHFPHQYHTQRILCYTEIVKNGMLFWADDNYRQNKSWYDNILVAWKTKCTKNQDTHIVDTPDNTKLVPAHLHLIF